MISGEALGMESRRERAGSTESRQQVRRPMTYRVNTYTKMRPSGARPTQPLELPVRSFGL